MGQGSSVNAEEEMVEFDAIRYFWVHQVLSQLVSKVSVALIRDNGIDLREGGEGILSANDA
jgi:hypothetical protein